MKLKDIVEIASLDNDIVFFDRLTDTEYEETEENLNDFSEYEVESISTTVRTNSDGSIEGVIYLVI